MVNSANVRKSKKGAEWISYQISTAPDNFVMRKLAPKVNPGDGVLRIAEDGTINEHYITQASDDGMALAFVDALTNVQDGDTIDCNGQRIELSGTGQTITNKTNVTIRNAKFARTDGTSTYTRMLVISGCDGFTLEDCIFDGEAVIAAPTDTPPTHSVGTSNNVGLDTASYMFSIVNSNETLVTDCEFMDHAGNEQTNAASLPFYYEAMAINIDSASRGTKVTNTRFDRIGYAGIADNGLNTQVDGCSFINCQWHGYVMRQNEFVLQNCLFTRETTTTIGYQGAVDISPSSQINHAVVEGCTFDFPYAVTPYTGGGGGGGMFMIKASDCDQLTIKNCTIKHGLCNTAANSVSHSIRFEGENVGKVTIDGCTLSGAIGHILGAGP